MKLNTKELNTKELNKIKKYFMEKLNYIKIWSKKIWFCVQTNEWIFEFEAVEFVNKRAVYRPAELLRMTTQELQSIISRVN